MPNDCHALKDMNSDNPLMGYPIEQIYPLLDEKLAQGGDEGSDFIIIALSGAGKSTLLLLHLLEQFSKDDELFPDKNCVSKLMKNTFIILVGTRRSAARVCAQRMANLLEEDVGQAIGHAMRMEYSCSSQTRIPVVTEGVFARMLVNDPEFAPELANVRALLFDEFHGRGLDADFGRALILDIKQALRPDLHLMGYAGFANKKPAESPAWMVIPPSPNIVGVF